MKRFKPLGLAVQAAIRGRNFHEASPYAAANAERNAIRAAQRVLDDIYRNVPLEVAGLHLLGLNQTERDALAYMAHNAFAGRNTAMDLLEYPEPTPAEVAAMLQARDDLPSEERKALDLWHESHDLQDVARQLGIPVSTAQNLLVRSIALLNDAARAARDDT
ncbi:sigma-70 family RNA polymerase sigma factor [Steroidobacter sp. S1-65]|uniref:Sigma-70 family RNA polymerase sigma factor n=1 Tax=Steroidobacter gossypii TaxID=2805490 RepID=A0ABS1WXD2_9GAMM|nr:sigma-70 family RNA polymerase sigma factor [Steroidobacter gossypii]MBM0105597.1 sigma-70 family RNA polymerase sigma factor [Steroidobacter gossypii]